MADCYLGEIRLFPSVFAPKGWAFCNGALLPIAGNEPLYSLIGTAYGGDGRTNFALPDFRGRVVLGEGQGPASTQNYTVGTTGGVETVTLTTAQMPQHNHAFNAQPVVATSEMPVDPAGTTLSTINVMTLAIPIPNGALTGLYIPANTTGGTAQIMDPNFLDYAGGAASGGSSTTAANAHNNMMPYLTLNYIIALTGIYPTRP